jgi:Tol biopolymer transport system component
MRLAPGARLGAYEITGMIGAGGMGEVYRARDTKLGREVAIKILPLRLSNDPHSLELFEKEARAVAALSHPNILAIHDFGENDSMVYAVMELLQGETLRARLKQGAIPARKSVEYAIQIAGALAAAHAKGIIHRDLKPENIFLTTDGHVKLLDFGLALQREPSAPVEDESSTPTLTQGLDSGSVVGTVGYMSPEQVRGAEADYRSDIFSFGCVLYEMLTGKRAFLYPTNAETMTAILREDPPEMLKASAEIPLGLERIVLHCLEKGPEERFQSARDLSFDLQTSLNASSSSAARLAADAMWTPPAERSRLRERVAWLAFVALLAVGVYTLVHFLRVARPAAGKVLSEIAPPENTQVGGVAVSPDGHLLAFIAWKDGRSQIWLRSLDALEQHPLANTDGAEYPFWSPDALQIGFFSDGKLKKIPASGGPAQILADAPAGRGGAWADDGTIIFAPSFDLPLYWISSAGGEASPLTKLDSSRGELSHRWPYFLPDAKHFLYFTFSTSQDKTGICVGSLDGKTKSFLIPSGYGAAYAAPGYLVFTRERALLAQPFDTGTLRFTGNAVTLADQIGVNELEYAHFSVAEAGNVLLYRRGGYFQGSELHWFARDGRPLSTLGATDRYWSSRLSPGDKSVAVEIQDAQSRANNIWIFDAGQSRPRRFTFNPTDDVAPIWSPDAKRIAFAARRPGPHYSLYTKPSSGAGRDEPLLQTEADAFPQDWSHDARFLLYVQLAPGGRAAGNIWALPMQGEPKPFPLVQTRFNSDYPRFSPNSRWIAYRSNESGHNEIYVIPFQLSGGQTSGGKWQVSVGGGDMPVWRADGKELFYLSPDQRVMAVAVREKNGTFEFDPPRALFQTHALGGLGNRYDVSDDGQRFLVLIQKEENSSPLTLVLNWSSGLKP